jgi:hypothetical protein
MRTAILFICIAYAVVSHINQAALAPLLGTASHSDSKSEGNQRQFSPDSNWQSRLRQNFGGSGLQQLRKL